MSTRTVRFLHRWIGLVFSIILFAASGSGMAHIVMEWFQSPAPKPTPFKVALTPDKIIVAPAQALKTLPANPAPTQMNLRRVGNDWFYIFTSKDQPVPYYVNAATGQMSTEVDALYAREIAQRFLNQTNLRQTAYLTDFSDEYPKMFKTLPVYRFDLDDSAKTRVYVSTTTESVTRHSDNCRQWRMDIFSNLHLWRFIENTKTREISLATGMAILLFVSASGVVLFFMTRPK